MFVDLSIERNKTNRIWFQFCRHSRDPCPVQLEEPADRPQHVPRSTETPIPVLRPERFRKNDLRLRGSGSIQLLQVQYSRRLLQVIEKKKFHESKPLFLLNSRDVLNQFSLLTSIECPLFVLDMPLRKRIKFINLFKNPDKTYFYISFLSKGKSYKNI